MIINNFRIKNYKSIIDSNDCYLTDTITIFAWKNESWKSSILEALEDFDSQRNIREEAVSLINEKEKPEISIIFSMESEELDYIIQDTWLDIDPGRKKLYNLKLIKSYPKKYTLWEETISMLGLNKEILEKWEELNLTEVYKKFPWKISLKKENNTYQELKNQMESTLNQINTWEVSFEEKKRWELVSYLTQKIKIVEEIIAIPNKERIFTNKMVEYLPSFILYNSFEDRFPNSIEIGTLQDSERAKDLANVSDFSIATIVWGSNQKKKEHKNKVNIQLKWKFQVYRTQDPITLDVDWNDTVVEFWIQENERPYKPDQRSQWQQRHLAFYLKVGARAKDDRPYIILIDEPWLYLHAKAQKDILKSLEDHAQEAQIVFTTHSPYLIETNKLNRIRLVFKDKNKWTEIFNKLHTFKDKDTLAPIFTAIGMDLGDGINDIWKVNNIVVEWPSEIFYISAFKKLFPAINNINFIFGWGGAGNMGPVGSILSWWWCNVWYLFDNDQAKKEWSKNLRSIWGIDKEKLISVTEIKWASIEDIFSKSFFQKYILEDETLDYIMSNSSYIKSPKKDKVLLARIFLAKVQSNEIALKDFDKNTIKSIKELCNKIVWLF